MAQGKVTDWSSDVKGTSVFNYFRQGTADVSTVHVIFIIGQIMV